MPLLIIVQDYACIDQHDWPNKIRGIDSLPVAVTLCDVMISLIDDTYYERAWCGIEVMLMDVLASSYGIHKRWEHVVESSGTNLRLAKSDRLIDPDKLKLTNERDDRPKIDFLARQSKLIGKDVA